MSGSSRIRTDLALEATESFAQSNTELRGVEVKEQYDEERDIRTTVVKITTENGAKAMGRPQGNYITIEAPNLSASDEDYHREISEEIARHLRKLVNLKRETSVLVVGLGNQAITADALGPHVVDNLRMTRHIIREYGLKKYRKGNSAPGQWSCAGRYGSDRNGNFRNCNGCGGRNKAGSCYCGRCPGSPQYQKAEPDSPDHGYGDSSRFRGGKSQDRTY